MSSKGVNPLDILIYVDLRYLNIKTFWYRKGDGPFIEICGESNTMM